MNWKDRAVLRILLLIAAFLANEEWRKQVEQLATQINLYAPKQEGDKA